MTKTEVLELIRNSESSGVDFKRDTIDNRALAKELVAFANLKGGRVLLGVEDGGAISGLTRSDPGDADASEQTPPQYKQLEEWVMQACRDKIRPELIPYFEVIRDVEPGRDIAVVEVERGWDVHHVWHNQHRTYYIRVGTTSREASQEELQRLFQQRGAFRSELRPISGSTALDLDRRRLRDYFERVRAQAVPAMKAETGSSAEKATAEREWEALLVNTELVGDGDKKPATLAGLVLFGQNPNRFLPQAGIDAVAHSGKEKEYDAKERASLRGPLVGLFDRKGALVESGVVEQALEFVRRNTARTTTLGDGATRKEESEYPEEALREAIVNAVVHRDYLLSGTDIELSIFDDRIEIVSPGQLPNGITPARMRVGCRAARNQLLKDVMRDYGYMEHMGMGVPRKIVKLSLEQNGTDPDLEEDGERFIVRLWKRKTASADQ